MLVLHRCDNPKCVNPDHLFIGTHQDNAKDREWKKRGRHPLGVMHGRARLTEKQVLKIRAITKNRTESYRSIGDRFNVNSATIRQIHLRKNWKHV